MKSCVMINHSKTMKNVTNIGINGGMYDTKEIQEGVCDGAACH